MMVPIVPTEKISSTPGLTECAECCVAKKILRSPASAISSARIECSLPTRKGIIMPGNSTASRRGIMGSVTILVWCVIVLTEIQSYPVVEHYRIVEILILGGNDLLNCLLNQRDRLCIIQNNVFCDHAFLHVLLRRQVVHQIQH